MVSRIAENNRYEFISIEHLGIVQNGVEDTTSEAARKWAPAFENYTFNDLDGVTEVLVDIDVEDEHAQMFNEMWPKGLRKLKELAEKQKAFVAKEKLEIVLSAQVQGGADAAPQARRDQADWEQRVETELKAIRSLLTRAGSPDAK